MSSKRVFTLAVLLIALLSVPGLQSGIMVAGEGQDRIGVAAPDLKLKYWLNSPPLEINELRGKVVLIRWWTDTCDLCAATAPALRKLQNEYGSQGFQVIGIFHPKPAGDWSVSRVQRAAARFQFSFPVALDGDWSALKRWWLNGAERSATSVSFVVDKHGVIRYVHPGGEFHESKGELDHAVCERDFRAIEKTVSQLLVEQ